MTESVALAALHDRVRRLRSRAAVRAWEYRQRNLAKGVWFDLRRLLAHAESAWSLPEDEAQRLLAEGYEAADVGNRLAPPKTILVVTEERLREVPGRAAVPLRLGPELLGARWLALVPFADTRR